jgi:hypothetical protein
MWRESADLTNARRKAGVPTVMLRVSVLQQFSLFNFFVQTFAKSVAHDLHAQLFSVAYAQHRSHVNPYFRPAHALLLIPTKA